MNHIINISKQRREKYTELVKNWVIALSCDFAKTSKRTLICANKASLKPILHWSTLSTYQHFHGHHSTTQTIAVTICKHCNYLVTLNEKVINEHSFIPKAWNWSRHYGRSTPCLAPDLLVWSEHQHPQNYLSWGIQAHEHCMPFLSILGFHVGNKRFTNILPVIYAFVSSNTFFASCSCNDWQLFFNENKLFDQNWSLQSCFKFLSKTKILK